ncbi:MAG TPA: DUF4157 domain-containing protein [Kofleriaceae bacterium]|nr:DUF4157 domain-containing protein [Kofleriaceae bacterium]
MQRKAAVATAWSFAAPSATAPQPHDDPFGMHLPSVQRKAGGAADAGVDVQEVAAGGVRGGGGSLPYLGVIQQAFGRHDVSDARAHTDDAARGAATAIGARAYATGNDIAFAGAPDLHTAAHEAAHVVQQRAGVHLAGGVGAEGDVYERHADAVADAVVAGRSAEALLDQHAGAASGAATSAVQRKTVTVAGGEFDDGGPDNYAPYKEQTVNRNGTFIERGAMMRTLKFTPRRDLTNAGGQPAREVSLVQTTNSTVVDLQNPHAEDQPESRLDERRTEDGSAIDQQLYLSMESGVKWKSVELAQAFQSMAGHGTVPQTNTDLNTLLTFFSTGKGSNDSLVTKIGTTPTTVKSKLKAIQQAEGGNIAPQLTQGIAEVERLLYAQSHTMNVDPRYPEQRSSSQRDLKQTQKVENVGTGGTTGWPARRDQPQDDWHGYAMLRDRPAHTVAEGHQLRGREIFETAAMADGDKMVGSIRWGWSIDGTEPQLTPAEIEKVDHGAASTEFFKAAKAWNEMSITDLDNPTVSHTPIQLPVGKASQLEWTDGKLDSDERNVGGSFEEYRNILDALRRYQSIKTQNDVGVILQALQLVKSRCQQQLDRRPGEARNEAVKEVMTDVDRVVAQLS